MPLGYSPSLLIGPVECWIDLGPDGTNQGIVERWPSDGPGVDVQYKCRWADRYDLAKALMGSSQMVGGVLLRTPPHLYPPSPNLYCASIGNILRIGLEVLQTADGSDPAGWVKGEYAILPASYQPARFDFGTGSEPPKDPSGQPWTTTRFHVSGEVFTPPNSTFVYCDGSPAGVPVHDSLVGIVRPQVEISMTRHLVPFAIDLSKIVLLIGGVNDNPIRFANQWFDEGHVLFGGFNATEQFDSLGNWTYEVEYGLLARHDYGWNTLMNQSGDWQIVNTVADQSGKFPFRYVDFAEIP